jgi:hypothetical protein
MHLLRGPSDGAKIVPKLFKPVRCRREQQALPYETRQIRLSDWLSASPNISAHGDRSADVSSTGEYRVVGAQFTITLDA